MGNTQSVRKINFEDVQTVIKNPELYILINTLPNTEQQCLIVNTTSIEQEESLINRYMKQNKDVRIIVYGKNCNDETVHKKYNQLISIGFYNVFIYPGGIFEWLVLQDMYGNDLFPTTKKELDFLKYKPPQILNLSLLTF
jgi:hypothetical protein